MVDVIDPNYDLVHDNEKFQQLFATSNSVFDMIQHNPRLSNRPLTDLGRDSYVKKPHEIATSIMGLIQTRQLWPLNDVFKLKLIDTIEIVQNNIILQKGTANPVPEWSVGNSVAHSFNQTGTSLLRFQLNWRLTYETFISNDESARQQVMLQTISIVQNFSRLLIQLATIAILKIKDTHTFEDFKRRYSPTGDNDDQAYLSYIEHAYSCFGFINGSASSFRIFVKKAIEFLGLRDEVCSLIVLPMGAGVIPSLNSELSNYGTAGPLSTAVRNQTAITNNTIDGVQIKELYTDTVGPEDGFRGRISRRPCTVGKYYPFIPKKSIMTVNDENGPVFGIHDVSSNIRVYYTLKELMLKSGRFDEGGDTFSVRTFADQNLDPLVNGDEDDFIDAADGVPRSGALTLEAWITKGIAIMLIRPRIKIIGHDVWALPKDLGHTYYTNPITMQEEIASTMHVEKSMALYAGPCVEKPNATLVVKNAILNGYLGGYGTEFFPEDMQKYVESSFVFKGKNEPSLILVPFIVNNHSHVERDWVLKLYPGQLENGGEIRSIPNLPWIKRRYKFEEEFFKPNSHPFDGNIASLATRGSIWYMGIGGTFHPIPGRGPLSPIEDDDIRVIAEGLSSYTNPNTSILSLLD